MNHLFFIGIIIRENTPTSGEREEDAHIRFQKHRWRTGAHRPCVDEAADFAGGFIGKAGAQGHPDYANGAVEAGKPPAIRDGL